MSTETTTRAAWKDLIGKSLLVTALLASTAVFDYEMYHTGLGTNAPNAPKITALQPAYKAAARGEDFSFTPDPVGMVLTNVVTLAAALATILTFIRRDITTIRGAKTTAPAPQA